MFYTVVCCHLTVRNSELPCEHHNLNLKAEFDRKRKENHNFHDPENISAFYLSIDLNL